LAETQKDKKKGRTKEYAGKLCAFLSLILTPQAVNTLQHGRLRLFWGGVEDWRYQKHFIPKRRIYLLDTGL